MVRLAVLLAIAASCGKELNPKFCAAHPEDERCEVIMDARANDALVDVGVDMAPPSCPASYTGQAAGQASRYRTVDTADDWGSAVLLCAGDSTATFRTHLAVVSSAAERVALAPLLDWPRWVGHSDRNVEGTFIAVTDEPISYTELTAEASPPWLAGQPNDDGDCLLMTAARELDDRICTNEDRAFLCECDQFANDPDNY